MSEETPFKTKLKIVRLHHLIHVIVHLSLRKNLRR